ncbi:MAG: response regulator [Bacteroidetes bacterium]|nr:response regulator [Bacteroidota bacterium]
MKKEFANWKILMIDDEPELLDLMKDVLEEERYQVFCASNGSDGILLNEQKNPDLILLDLRMPEMDGIETLRNIRKNDDKVRVVILTGYGCPDTIRDAADLNVSEYLSKPFENEDLVSVISKALEL